MTPVGPDRKHYHHNHLTRLSTARRGIGRTHTTLSTKVFPDFGHEFHLLVSQHVRPQASNKKRIIATTSMTSVSFDLKILYQISQSCKSMPMSNSFWYRFQYLVCRNSHRAVVHHHGKPMPNANSTAFIVPYAHDVWEHGHLLPWVSALSSMMQGLDLRACSIWINIAKKTSDSFQRIAKALVSI